MKSVVIEGSSTAYGMHAGEYGGWAAQLHRDSQPHNEQHRFSPRIVANYALPGLTLPYFNKQFPYIVAPLARMCERSLIRVLSVGINEAKIMPGESRPIVSLGSFATYLSVYSQNGKRLEIPTVYVGPQPIDDSRRDDRSYTIEDDLLEAYGELIRERAENDAMPFVDVRELFGHHTSESLLAKDGIHPNAFGHQIIYEGVHTALQEVPTILDY